MYLVFEFAPYFERGESPSSCTAKECANSTVHLLIGERIFEGFLGALGLQIKLLKIALQLLYL